MNTPKTNLPSGRARRALKLFPALMLAMAALGGCASERDPINRVQANALEKSFFVGGDLASDSDDPEFYYRPTVVDVDYGAQTQGLFTASYAQTLARVRWEVTEDLLIARLSYERIEDSTGNGLDATATGQIVAAFSIDKHFDIRRDYNPQTGEDLNVIVENDTDRPWYEREFMRVDWSQNLVTSAYELDTLAALRLFQDEPLVYEPVAYAVEDPASPDAPHFEAATGYFDITNKAYATPQEIDTPYGRVPACYFSPDAFGGGAPVANCNPVELKLRLSFRRVEDRDYQPVDWDGTRQSMFGMFTSGERRGYERNYGIVDDRWYRFASRHNLWRESHARDEDGELVRCNYWDAEEQRGTPPGADPDRDADPVDGTADECESVGEGSRCDRAFHACTLPYREREVRTIPYYYGPESDGTLWQSVSDAVAQWDGALRHAVQTARYTECIRVTQDRQVATPEEIAACREEFPVTQEGALEAVPKILMLCHNPVTEDDDPACGEPGLAVRVGDLRYNMANVIQSPQVPSPWGILADAVDPLTGEVVSASVNIWNAVTDIRAQLTVDQMRWYLGELSNEDVSSGRYLNDFLKAGTRDQQPRASAAPMLSNEERDRRVSALDRSLKPEEAPALPKGLSQRQLLDWASEQTRQTYGEAVLGTGNAGVEQRRALAKQSGVETALTTASFLRLGGLDKATPIDDTALELASPLRGNAVAFRAELERLRELQQAEQGRCTLAGAEPTSISDWAAIMAEKFPLPENPSSSEVLERNQKWHDYLRRKLTFGVILHELGHSMGLRHVFTSSFDAFNYHPQYWQLRTRNGEETDYCSESTDDGAKCVGPRWLDPVTSDERQGMIWMWQHTSVMDYPGDLAQEGVGLGAYDRAAVRFLYGDVAEVIDDGQTTCTPASGGRQCTQTGNIAADLLDSSFGGLSGPWYGFGNGIENTIHYSQLGNAFGLVRNCREADTSPPSDWDEERDGVYSPVFDGQIVGGTRCDGLPTDYVAYSEMQLDTPGFQQQFDAFGGPTRKFDPAGRVRRPFLFGSDEYADIGNLPVLRDDNGADAYEVTDFLIQAYEDAHLWDNYRRNRSSFSLRNAFTRGYDRYNHKLKEIGKGFGLYQEIFSGTGLIDVVTTGPGADGLLRPSALASSMIFDHLTRMLTRPSSGEHFRDNGYDPRKLVVLRSTDQSLVVNDPPGNQGSLTSLFVPDGTTGVGVDVVWGGRPLHNALDDSKGYYATLYDAWVGSYYDKTQALELLTDSADHFISQSRDDFIDGRYRNISFASMFPDGMRRLLGTALTEDHDLLGWRVESRDGRPLTNSAGLVSGSMGTPSFWPATGPETCWRRGGSIACRRYPDGAELGGDAPSESLPLDPELGIEVQKFIVFWSMLNLPENWKQDWVDQLRVFKTGLQPDPEIENAAVWIDPETSQGYIAHRQGYEMVNGQEVERGVAARVLDWMAVLTEAAYECRDADADENIPGATRVCTYADDSACPEGVSRCKGLPIVKSPRFVARVRGYKALIDFMNQVTANFGFDDPSWRGVF